MRRFILRLDDACEYRDVDKWDRMETLLDKYHICPLVGVIPQCEDSVLLKYSIDNDFWDRVHGWIKKDWSIAMHGFNHVYSTKCGGINPVNQKSEFAGESLDTQRSKIRQGVSLMRHHGIDPQYFFAPSHTFDENTLIAIKEESNIKVISDTVAWDCYSMRSLQFVPQQTGQVRNLPFRTVTFCYHPNVMEDKDFDELELFIKQHHSLFTTIQNVVTNRKKDFIDIVLCKLYFLYKAIRFYIK